MNEIDNKDRKSLMNDIMQVIMENGIKATTMDNVAAMRSMSKRTLYEIFGSKEGMIKEVLEWQHHRNKERFDEIIQSAPNVMEAMLKVFIYQGQSISRASVAFLNDMDSFHNNNQKLGKAAHIELLNRKAIQAIQLGIRQGVFHPDVNYKLTLLMTFVQMESLKRMEEFFPPNVTLKDAYDVIYTGLLRSIATPKGMEIIDSLLEKYKQQ